MKISVVMSVYKSETAEHLNEALHSIWTTQTYKPNEIILVEDGELTPQLYEVVENWQNILGNQLVILKNDTNLGLTKSLNRGIAIAKYDIIARMDSDDKAHPDRFMKQIAYIKDHADVDILGGSIQEFYEDHLGGIRYYPASHNDVLHYIYKASPLAHPAVIMRKSIFDNGLKYNEAYRTSQDIALWFDAICKGHKIANIKDIVLYFRCSDDIYKRRGKEKARNEFRIYRDGIRRIYGRFTPKLIYPILRYCVRLSPTPLLKIIYNGGLRKRLLNK